MLWTCLFISSKMLTFLVAFTSSDVTVLQRLSNIRVMSFGYIEKFSVKMVKLSFENN